MDAVMSKLMATSAIGIMCACAFTIRLHAVIG